MSTTVEETWQPTFGPTPILLRWSMTQWCNYSCIYCTQKHDRYAEWGKYTAHAFDNYPVEDWGNAFDRHFSNHKLSMVITGGEPLIDYRNMYSFLERLLDNEYLACVRIDTNASWQPEKYKPLDKSKIILMCTFHPTQVDEAKFINKMDALRSAGFHIGIINYVMDSVAKDEFVRRQKLFMAQGLILHPNPLWKGLDSYSELEIAMIKNNIPSIDFIYRTGLESPYGKRCLYPSISYEMDHMGAVKTGCTKAKYSFFDAVLPSRPIGWTSCPLQRCACLDKYSFLEGSNRNISLNPLADYSEILSEIICAADT